jgi:hypothetical protein
MADADVRFCPVQTAPNVMAREASETGHADSRAIH